MQKKNTSGMNYRSMTILAILVGVAGVILQFIPDFGFFSFFLGLPVLGGLMAESNHYEEPERLRLERSYKTAFEGLILIVFTAYALLLFSGWLHVLEGAAVFVNGHWPGLVISAMCALIGLAAYPGRAREVTAG